MKKLIDFFLKNNRVTLTLLAMILTLGSLSYIRVPKESFPDIKIPVVLVNMPYEGISPEDAESILLKPVQKQVRSIEGLKEMRGKAFEGGAHLTLEFEAGSDIKTAKDNVRDKVDAAKADLPQDLREPQIMEISTSNFPVLTVKLSGDVAEQVLVNMAKELKDEIEGRVSEVLEVRIRGEREEMVQVTLSPHVLETYALPLDQVITLFNQNNKMITSGNMDYQKGVFPIKIPGLVSTIEDLMDLPIIQDSEKSLTFKDVARISKKYKDATSVARDWGRRAMALEITKRGGENIIATVEKVKALMAEAQKMPQWPREVKVNYSQDQTEQIRTMLSDLQNGLILALILVMAIIVYSMGWRPSVFVGLAVPGAFLAGILILSYLGLTLNMIVLFSLILAVGMLVDGAIIVVEYAERRMEEGVPPKQAYREASHRMAIPVLTSIGTIIIVFMPLLVWPGVVGEFMKFMPITLIATLAGSFAMALFFIPTLGALFSKKTSAAAVENTSSAPLAPTNLENIKGFTGKYVAALQHALNYPWRVMGGAAALMVAVLFIYTQVSPGVVFFPDSEPEQARIAVRARGSLSLAERDAMVKQVEHHLMTMPEIKTLYATTFTQRQGGGGFGGSSGPNDTVGHLFIEFIDWQKRRPAAAILGDFREKVAHIPAIKLDIEVERSGPPRGKPIKVRVASSNRNTLEQGAESIVSHLRNLPGIVDLEDNRFLPGMQWNVQIDRVKAAKYGATVQVVGSMLRFLTTGLKMGTVRPEGAREELDVYARFPTEERNLDSLKHFRVRTAQGLIPLSNFATITPQQKVGTINHIDGQRTITIQADVAPGHFAQDKTDSLKAYAAALEATLPGLKVKFDGDDKDQKEAGEFLGGAFGLAIFMVLLVLLMQFNSFFSAGLVLSSVVMSTIGVFIGLSLHQVPFSIVMCGVGIISLAGIIVSNNIIMIDTYDQVAPETANKREAILFTCAQRLRPILLTQITVILGLLPIMYGVNIDFVNLDISVGAPFTQFWKPLATCIVYGVFFASALTLFVTPAALMARENWRARSGEPSSE